MVPEQANRLQFLLRIVLHALIYISYQFVFGFRENKTRGQSFFPLKLLERRPPPLLPLCRHPQIDILQHQISQSNSEYQYRKLNDKFSELSHVHELLRIKSTSRRETISRGNQIKANFGGFFPSPELTYINNKQYKRFLKSLSFGMQ